MAFDIQFKLIYQGIRDVFRVRSLSFYFSPYFFSPKNQKILLSPHTLRFVMSLPDGESLAVDAEKAQRLAEHLVDLRGERLLSAIK